MTDSCLESKLTTETKHLGLDVSTSCTGVCLLDEKGEIVKLGYINLAKQKGLVPKANEFASKFKEWLPDTSPEKLLIAVEEAAQAYRRGLSSAKTIATLNQFNGMVQLIAADYTTSLPVTELPVNCRSACGIKTKPQKKCGISTKEQVRVAFEAQTGVHLPKKKLKSGPRKGMMIYDTRNYDAIDAWVVARWSWLTNKKK